MTLSTWKRLPYLLAAFLAIFLFLISCGSGGGGSSASKTPGTSTPTTDNSEPLVGLSFNIPMLSNVPLNINASQDATINLLRLNKAAAAALVAVVDSTTANQIMPYTALYADGAQAMVRVSLDSSTAAGRQLRFVINKAVDVSRDSTTGALFDTTTVNKRQIVLWVPTYDATNNPWGVWDITDLYNLRNSVAGEVYQLQANLRLPDTTAASIPSILGNSYATAGWAPIPNFAATFDGNNLTIDNLKATAAMPNFGFINTLTGKVKNLNITNAVITNPNFLTQGNDNGGILAGNTTSTALVQNVSVSGQIKDATTVGGMVGLNVGTINGGRANVNVTGLTTLGGLVGLNNGTITNSDTTGVINASGSNVGGLVGMQSSGSIDYSIARGTINVTLLPSTNINSVGGLVGNITGGSVTRSASFATIPPLQPLSGSSLVSVGGLAGTISLASLSKSYSTVLLTNVASNLVGGLAGRAVGNTTANATITDCYATGSLTGSLELGTLVGYVNYASITNAWATGTVSATNSLYAGWIGSALSPYTGSGLFVPTARTAGANTGTISATKIGSSAVQATFAGFDFTNTWKFTAGMWPQLQDTTGVQPSVPLSTL